ncbi:protein NipSnap homolog 3A-like [Halichondria panicea]|uniref:protein NipSnap homolog 3A-like n=1 Tax=Halichondria panicea TaxID=6063 RepID=UPI00312BCAB9
MVDKKMALLTGRSFLLKSRPYIFCRACISTTSARASNGSIEDLSNGKLYELRTYAIKPDKFGEFTKIMQEGYMLRTAHSKLIGYWSTDLGGVNEVVHIWEYDNYSHRTAVRKALSQDKDWIEKCFSRILPMFANQTNVVLKAFPWCKLQLEPGQGNPGVFELVSYQVKSGLVSQFEHRLLQDYPQLNYNPLGLWYSVFGDINRVYSLLRYDSLDQREKVVAKANDDEVVRETMRDLDKYLDGTVKKALVPTTFSALQ